MAMRRFTREKFWRELERRACHRVTEEDDLGSFWLAPDGRYFQVPPPDADDRYPDWMLDDLIRRTDYPRLRDVSQDLVASAGGKTIQEQLMSDRNERPELVITLTEAPDAADTAVIQEGLRAYNTEQAGRDDYRPLAVFVTDPMSGKVLGGLYGGSYLGQLRVDRFFLPAGLRRDRLGSRLLAMAEEEGRRRGCARISLNTLAIQARGFYEKQGYQTAATLDCDPPGVTRYLMTKKL